MKPKNHIEFEPEKLHIAELAEQLTGTESHDQEISEETQEAVAALSLEDQFILIQRGNLNYLKPEGIGVMETDEPWKVLAPRPRMFQEAFCRPPFVVHDDKKNARRSANGKIIDFSFVSPVLYPDTLMEHVTGDTPSYTNTSEEGMKQRAKRIPHLKTLFKNLQPICDFNLKPLEQKEDTGRISVLPRKQDELNDLPEETRWPRGAIIVSNNPRRKDGPKRHFSFYRNFFDFLRSLKHTLANYSGRYRIDELQKRPEFEVLNQLRADIRTSIDTLQNWKKLSATQKEEVQSMISELKKLLAGVRDQYKLFSRDHLGDAESLKERNTQKYNPGCTCAKLVGAFNDIMSRFENCVGIERSVEESLEMLESTRKGAQMEFGELDSDIESLLEDDYFKANRLIDDPEGVEIILEYSETLANGLINQVIDRLQELIDNDSLPAPYPQWAEAVLQNLQAAQIIMKRIGQLSDEEVKALGPIGIEKVHEKAVENAIRANLTFRCIGAQKDLSNIISTILSRPWDFDPISLYDEVDDIHREIDPHAFRENYKSGDVGAKVLFKVQEVDQLSQYCRDLKHMLKVWQRERMRINDEIRWYQGTYQDIPTDEYLENLSGYEDKKIDLDIAHLNAIYDEVKAFDFEDLFEALGNYKSDIQHAKRTTMAHRFLENMGLYTVDGNYPAAGE